MEEINFFGSGSGLWNRPLIVESLALEPGESRPRAATVPIEAREPASFEPYRFSHNGHLHMNFFGTGAWRTDELILVTRLP